MRFMADRYPPVFNFLHPKIVERPMTLPEEARGQIWAYTFMADMCFEYADYGSDGTGD